MYKPITYQVIFLSSYLSTPYIYESFFFFQNVNQTTYNRSWGSSTTQYLTGIQWMCELVGADGGTLTLPNSLEPLENFCS
jgi:hypothetical protein